MAREQPMAKVRELALALACRPSQAVNIPVAMVIANIVANLCAVRLSRFMVVCSRLPPRLKKEEIQTPFSRLLYPAMPRTSEFVGERERPLVNGPSN